MGTTDYAAYDPVFYLNHNMVDLVWAVYQFENAINPPNNPNPTQLTLGQHPFDYPAENPQDITSMNFEVGETLDYENNLCYTYDLTGINFPGRSLDINSPSIVFGGKNLSQILEDVERVKLTNHLYAGLFIRSLRMSYTISINICSYYGLTKLRCFPGAEFFVFGGKDEKPYINSVVTKIDITKILANNFMTIADTENIKFEIDSVRTVKGKEVDKKSLMFQPVSVFRPSKNAKAKGDQMTLFLGSNQENKYAPKMHILYGTRMKLIYQQEKTLEKEKIQFYKTKNREGLDTCDTTFATEVRSKAEDFSVTAEFVVDSFSWYFAKGKGSCYPLETEIAMYSNRFQ